MSSAFIASSASHRGRSHGRLRHGLHVDDLVAQHGRVRCAPRISRHLRSWRSTLHRRLLCSLLSPQRACIRDDAGHRAFLSLLTVLDTMQTLSAQGLSGLFTAFAGLLAAGLVAIPPRSGIRDWQWIVRAPP